MSRRLSRRSLLAAAGVCGAALAGCTAGYRSSSVVDASSMEPTSTPPTTLEDGPLSATWETDIPGQFTLSTPGVDDDRLYVGSRTELTAIALADGAVDWQVDLGALTHGFTPAVADGTVVASARDLVGRQNVVDRGGTPSLTALDPKTGAEQWRFEIPISASPVIADGTVFVPLVDDSGTAISARDLATGEEQWRRDLSTPDVFAAPAVGEGLYVTTTGNDNGDSTLLALTRDGNMRWSLNLDGEVYKGPRVVAEPDGETVFVGTDAGYLYAVGDDGEPRWQATLGNPVNTTPSVDEERVYATTPQRVIALDRESGAGLWSGEVDHVSKTGVGLGGGMVHVGGNEVAAFDAVDGAARWRVELPGVAGTFGSPIWRDGTLYTGGCIKLDGSSRYDHVVYGLD
ncbi:MAG: outer membrane protein assembly factor BamB [Natronomonas sp.]|jgi:outer membrane protein assembly factor BamB|uniref:outer membrane protein assembly factor BamB family protein n=1 Tax=Natronomonas sp. TaxID=2184060 RepID=UPI0039890035